MKKLLLISAILFLQSTSQAQTTTEPVVESTPVVVAAPFSRVYIGGRVMATVTSINFNTLENGSIETTTIMGYGFGGFLGFNLSKHVGIQAELLYSSLAQKAKYNGSENTIRLKYVNVPLLLVLNTNVTSPVNLNISFGPQMGIKTSAKIENSNGNNTDTLTTTFAVKPYDLGFCYGAGLDFRVSKVIIFGLGFRGVFGLIDISDDSKSQTTNNFYILDRSKIKTYSGYASLALTF